MGVFTTFVVLLLGVFSGTGIILQDVVSHQLLFKTINEREFNQL